MVVANIQRPKQINSKYHSNITKIKQQLQIRLNLSIHKCAKLFIFQDVDQGSRFLLDCCLLCQEGLCFLVGTVLGLPADRRLAWPIAKSQISQTSFLLLHLSNKLLQIGRSLGLPIQFLISQYYSYSRNNLLLKLISKFFLFKLI